ncbi:murein biosynthesis integral membrane protein MurJ [Ruania alkalisoli]|uniref:Murein biosynthesis integral membrane protein MurJ n=1 Tax=Ruania alkalisoli TaxID=2779775 RepID=A0A7M1ST55_9MICO|nr:murein biosynthesis integral membrane protein MurJ [Ruania alkalisoli]QOR70749.1 murein biosynthesis integral membrane protein MurJ [Ruania alkalisoli]
MAGNSGLAGSAAVMFSGTLVSRILGVLRNALMVAAIGVTGSGAANAFSVANKLPNIIFMLLAGGILNAVLVPQIVRAMRNADGGTEYVNRLLTLAATVMGLITLVLTAAAGALVTLYAADLRDSPWMPLAVAFAMWCIPQLFFYGLYTLLGQLLNARSNFGPYMWAPVLNNLISIAGLVAYLVVYGTYLSDPPSATAWDAQRILLLAGPWTIGVAAQALVLIVPLYRSGFRYRPRWGLRNTGLRSAGRVALWAFAALAVGQVGYLAISNLAAAAGTRGELLPDPASVAGNAAYDNAFLIFMLPQSLITVSLVTAMFTRLSEHAAAGRAFRVRDDLSRGLRTLAVFTIFAAAAFMVLAIPLTQVVTFDQATFASYRAVGHVLVAMLIGLPAIAIWTMAQRVYFAYEDAKSLFVIQVPMAGLQIVGSVVSFLLLDVQWWVVGAGAATALSNMFGALVAYLALRRKLPNLDGARVLRTHVRVVLAAVPTALLGWGVLHLWGVQTSFVGAVLRVLVLGGGMGLLYLVLLKRFRVDELDQLTARIAAMLAPLTRRLEPLTSRLTVPGPLRTIWFTIVGENTGMGGTPVAQGTTTSLEPGITLADRYVLEAASATDLPGASAWSGQDEILQRPVQVTTLQGQHRDEALDAARRAALISDPRLRRIVRVGTHDDVAFVVSEPPAGTSLAGLVSGGRLPAAQARTLVGEAATAIELSRKRGVHHLYLRPSALEVAADGSVQLGGLAVDAAQAGMTPVDPQRSARTDAVDLVALLYTALTGHWPGAPERSGGLPTAPRIDGAPVPPGELADGVPHDLDTLCAVTFGPHEDGPYTAGELVRELEPWDAPGAVTAITDRGEAPRAVGATDSATVASATVTAPPDSLARSADGSGPVDDAAGPEGTAGTEGTESTESTGSTEHTARTHRDPSTWAPHPLPDDPQPVAFSEVLDGAAPEVPPGYHARHAGDVVPGQPRVTRAPAPHSPVQAPAASAGSALSDGTSSPAQVGGDEPPSRPTTTAGAGESGHELRRPVPPVLGWDTPGQQAAPTHPTVTTPTVQSVLGGWLRAAGSAVRGRFMRETEDEDGVRERFNPTPIVIFVMVTVVVVATILAIGSLREASTSFNPDDHTREPITPTTAAPSEEPTGEPSEEPSPEPTPSASAAPIEIADVRSLDPSTGVGDNEDLARYAVDGDPESSWQSLRYDNPSYGIKEGLGFAVVLEATSTVTSVTVDVQGAGGVLQIRNTSPDDPGGGEVLAEGEMGPEMTYTLSEPTDLDAVVLWFPELPVAESDGRNRIELAEITVN